MWSLGNIPQIHYDHRFTSLTYILFDFLLIPGYDQWGNEIICNYNEKNIHCCIQYIPLLCMVLLYAIELGIMESKVEILIHIAIIHTGIVSMTGECEYGVWLAIMWLRVLYTLSWERNVWHSGRTTELSVQSDIRSVSLTEPAALILCTNGK